MEFDGPSHFLASRAPTGATLLKRRQLQLLGHALVSVPYWEWDACRGAGEWEQYLRSKLGACSPSAVHGRRLDEGTKAYQDVQADDEAVSNSGGARSASNSTGARSAGSGAAAAAAAEGATAKGSQGKAPAIGEKRTRTHFTASQKVFLEQALLKGDLDTPQKRQKVADLVSDETGKRIDRKVIDTWHRNHKPKTTKDGE